MLVAPNGPWFSRAVRDAMMAQLGRQTASGWLMLFVPILFLLLNYGVVRAEEHYLSRKFGDDYLVYMRQVRRWLANSVKAHA